MDGQARRLMIRKQKREMEKQKREYLRRTPRVARGYRCNNIRRATKAELALFNILSSIEGIRFIFQKPIREYRSSTKFYIADFYILTPHKIVIEADGEYHEGNKEYDTIRDSMMKRHGVRVMRFKNEDILNNPDMVKAKIELAAVARGTQNP